MDEAQLSEIVEELLQNPKNLATKSELNEQAKVAVKLFLDNDSDCNDVLTFDELKNICDFMGLPIEENEEKALKKIDTDNSGSLSIVEWISWWLKRISNFPNPLKQQESIALNTFRKFDRDNSGYLDAEEF
jgi:Ca2+-binding EF-hand superfamily protein